MVDIGRGDLVNSKLRARSTKSCKTWDSRFGSPCSPKPRTMATHPTREHFFFFHHTFARCLAGYVVELSCTYPKKVLTGKIRSRERRYIRPKKGGENAEKLASFFLFRFLKSFLLAKTLALFPSRLDILVKRLRAATPQVATRVP